MAEPFQQEEILGKAYDIRLIRRLWKFIVPYKRLFWMAMLLLPLQQAFGLAQPYLMKIGIDQYIAGRDLKGLQNVGLLFLGVVVGETVTLFSTIISPCSWRNAAWLICASPSSPTSRSSR